MKQNFSFKKASRTIFPFAYSAILFGVLAYLYFIMGDVEGRYRLLAESFLAGKLYFTTDLAAVGDTTPFGGRYYWPQGPFPALIMMPFLWAGYLPEMALSLALTFGVFLACYRLARKYYDSSDTCWLALAFTFATSLIGVVAAP